MRLLLLFLVLVNVGWYYYWIDRQPLPDRVAVAPADPGVAPLRLLQETAQRPSGAAARKSATDTAPTCFRLGPISEQAQVEQIAVRLSDIGVGTGQARRASGQESAYHVVIAPLDSEEAVQQVSSQLASSGIANFSILRHPGQALGILLGVFTDAKAAAQRREQVAALGYNARVEIQASGGEQYWLDVHVYGQPERLDGLMRAWPAMRLEPQRCE